MDATVYIDTKTVKTLPAGEVLTLTAHRRAVGRVRSCSGPPGYVPSTEITWIDPSQSFAFGPFPDTTRWIVEGIHPSRRNAPIAEQLERLTETIRSHRIIASALVERNELLKEKTAMALSDKFKNLADRARAVPQRLETQADELFGRLDAVEQRGGEAFSKMHGVIAEVESGVAAAEDAVNQLTNGGPPLDGSKS